MRKFIFFVSVCVLFSFCFSSCGSTWEFSGNNVEIKVCPNDTLVSAGTIVLIPDSSVRVRSLAE